MKNVQKVTYNKLLNLQLGMLPVSDDTLYVGDEIFMADNLSGVFDGEYEKTLKHLPGKLQIFVCVICIDGSITFWMDGEVHTLSRCDVAVIPPGVIAENVFFEKDVRVISLAFSLKRISILPGSKITLRIADMLFREPRTVILHMNEDDMNNVKDFYIAARKVFRIVPEDYLPDAIQGFLDTMGNIYFGMFPDYYRNKDRSDQDDDLLSRFLGCLYREASQNRKVSWYADKLCVSPKHFSRVISKASGKSPEKWIRDRVVLEAKTLLIDRSLSIGEISEMLNFPNPSFFGSYFKSATGMTPGEYRNIRTR